MGAEEDKKKKAAKMARRKQEVQLQQEIETTEEWEEMMAKEGLWVIDVYQEWCGPCAAMVTNFRRLKNELGDSLLHFAVAKADTVDALDKYRGRCEPCFLYFAGGMLVAVVHGANAPVILRSITEQLAAEHKVMDGTCERKEMKDPLIAGLEEKEKAMYDEEENEKEEEVGVGRQGAGEEGDDNVLDYRGERVNYGDTMAVSTSPDEEKKGFTVALIKPDAVESGKVDEIVEQMKEAGIEILAQEERQLTEDEAREFYSHLKDEEYYEDLVKFMSSGPSFALVLTKGQRGESILQEWRDMIGPTTVQEAKEQAPESLRAKYGKDSYMNALHGSDSPETAAREMAFFFPHMAQPIVPRPGSQPRLQRTLALIRPDAFRNNRDEIMEKIKEAGFKVALQKEMTLTKEQAEEFYKEHQDKPYFEKLTTKMSSGPLLALGLAREDAVQGWRDQLGPAVNAKEEAPESLRAQFTDEDSDINVLHGSDSPEAAEKEIQFFFPMQQTVAAIKPDAFGTKEDIIDKIHEAGFRIAARKETTITKEIAEEFYGEHKDKEYFNDLVSHMCSGPTMFMVLSREEAVTGWREVIGPTDPEQAKAEAPDTLRAQFGQSILQNAVHGSSNTDHAKQSIEQVFGHLDFNPDGTVKGEETEVIHDEPTKEQEEKAVEDTDAGEEAGDVAPEFKTEETVKNTGKVHFAEKNQIVRFDEGESEETKQAEQQQESSEDNEQEQGGTAQGDEGTKKEGDEAEPQTEQADAEQPKSEGDAEAKGESGEEKTGESETKTEAAEGESEKKDSPEEAADAGEGKGEDKTEESKDEEKGDESKTDDDKAEEIKGGDSKGEETKEDDAKGEETKEETKGEESKGEESKGEESKGEESKGEESKGEESKGEEQKGDDATKTEESERKDDDAKKDDETKTDEEKKEETKT